MHFQFLAVNTSTKAMSCYPHLQRLSKSRKSYNERRYLISAIKRDYEVIARYNPVKPSTQRDFTEAASRRHYSPASSEMVTKSLYVTGIISDILGLWVNELVGMTKG